ncbi:MAG TPA: hypothetical protein VG056_03070 [Pirellulales bacterium]|jgi:hypothetical protein|nr:hypothetical protein [Pirellulales bacterium]
MLSLWFALALWSADIKTTTTGTAAGVNYSVEESGIPLITSFEISADEFRYARTQVLGFSTFRTTINHGHLFINGKDRATIKTGDQLAISCDNEVKVNGQVVP